MTISKPTIFIYISRADQDLLQEALAGMEEEGLSGEIFEKAGADPEELAREAAKDSMLGSGIGIAGSNAALSMRAGADALIVEKISSIAKEDMRRMGANSARVLKKLGLKEA